MKAPRIWFYRPSRGGMRWSPLWLGGDEWYRRTLVIGWGITGQVVIPLWRQIPADGDTLCLACGLMLIVGEACPDCART